MSRGPALIGDRGEPVEVPFEGLRRNARALAGGLILLLVIAFLLPDLTPPPTQPPPVELLRGRIVEFLPERPRRDGPGRPDPGPRRPRAGETLDGYLQGPSGEEDLPRYQVGDEVVVNASQSPTRRSSRSPTCTGSRPSRSCSGSSRSP